MSNQLDVNIYNGRIHMQVTTVTGKAENIEAIRKAAENSRFDVAGSNIRISHFENAADFMRKFHISKDGVAWND